VELKSGGYIIINPTEAMITIDVNSGRASNKRNIEETAFKTNLEAAEEIARQLRLRDLGGLIVIDFIDMRDRKHDAEVEKAFKKALSVDRARIQLSRISKFGILELSRQKKQSTIQEISYAICPFCKGRGVRPSLEYTALSAYRKIESQAVKGTFSVLKITLPYEVADYLLNQKRSEISKLENVYDISIHISGDPDTSWDELKIETRPRERIEEIMPEPVEPAAEAAAKPEEKDAEAGEQIKKIDKAVEATPQPVKKKSRRKPRYRKKKPEEKAVETPPETAPETQRETKPDAPPEAKRETAPVREDENNPLNRLRKIFEQLID
jgi:ribonuclease E